MRIKRRKNGYWYAIPESGKPFSLRTADKDTALRAAIDEDRKPKGDTVAAIVSAYLADKSAKPSHPKMLDAWKAASPHFGHLRPDQITRAVSKAYWLKRAGRSNGTIIKELTMIRAALRWHDKHTPAIIETPETPSPRGRFITKAEYRRLFYASRTAHMKVFLALAWYTAARKEALLSLTWDRVNMDTRKILLGPDIGKKGRPQTLPMNKALYRILAIAKRGAVGEHVVSYASKRVGNIKKGFANAAERAGLDDLTPHDIRRSAARHMIEHGRSMSEISQVLGHKSEAVTSRVYARFSPSFLKAAINSL